MQSFQTHVGAFYCLCMLCVLSRYGFQVVVGFLVGRVYERTVMISPRLCSPYLDRILQWVYSQAPFDQASCHLVSCMTAQLLSLLLDKCWSILERRLFTANQLATFEALSAALLAYGKVFLSLFAPLNHTVRLFDQQHHGKSLPKWCVGS